MWLFSSLISSGDWCSGCQQHKQKFMLTFAEPMEDYSHKWVLTQQHRWEWQLQKTSHCGILRIRDKHDKMCTKQKHITCKIFWCFHSQLGKHLYVCLNYVLQYFFTICLWPVFFLALFWKSQLRGIALFSLQDTHPWLSFSTLILPHLSKKGRRRNQTQSWCQRNVYEHSFHINRQVVSLKCQDQIDKNGVFLSVFYTALFLVVSTLLFQELLLTQNFQAVFPPHH